MSTDLNMVALTGRLTRDAELKYTNTGTPVVSMTIAVNEGVKNQDGTWEDRGHFFDLTLWGQYGERLKDHLTKGRQISVQGRLKYNTWTDQSGQNRSRVTVHVQFVQLLATPSGSASNTRQNSQNAPVSTPQNQSYRQSGTNIHPRQEQPNFDGFSNSQHGFDPPGVKGPEFFDDDIPF
jgi:single-strand DNA-binding protein